MLLCSLQAWVLYSLVRLRNTAPHVAFSSSVYSTRGSGWLLEEVRNYFKPGKRKRKVGGDDGEGVRMEQRRRNLALFSSGLVLPTSKIKHMSICV